MLTSHTCEVLGVISETHKTQTTQSKAKPWLPSPQSISKVAGSSGCRPSNCHHLLSIQRASLNLLKRVLGFHRGSDFTSCSGFLPKTGYTKDTETWICPPSRQNHRRLPKALPVIGRFWGQGQQAWLQLHVWPQAWKIVALKGGTTPVVIRGHPWQ